MAPRPDESDHVVTTLVHRFVEEAWNQRRLEILDEILVPDYTIRSLQHGAKERRLIGIDAVKHHIHEFLSAFPDLQLALEELVVEGERAAAYCRFRGTHKGPFFGIRATEKPVEFVIVTFFQAAEGRLKGHATLFDILGLLQQLGRVEETSKLLS